MHEIRDAAAGKIQRLASPCLACGKQKIEHNDGHTYALIATEIALPESVDLEFLFKLWKEHRWTELNQIQRFGEQPSPKGRRLLGARMRQYPLR